MTQIDLLPNNRLVMLHKVISNMEVFNDQTTESIIMRNFKPNRHSLLLEHIFRGCKNLKKLILSFSYLDDSDRIGEFAELNKETLIKS
jgi:hypothetical protein